MILSCGSPWIQSRQRAWHLRLVGEFHTRETLDLFPGLTLAHASFFLSSTTRFVVLHRSGQGTAGCVGAGTSGDKDSMREVWLMVCVVCTVNTLQWILPGLYPRPSASHSLSLFCGQPSHKTHEASAVPPHF